MCTYIFSFLKNKIYFPPHFFYVTLHLCGCLILVYREIFLPFLHFPDNPLLTCAIVYSDSPLLTNVWILCFQSFSINDTPVINLYLSEMGLLYIILLNIDIFTLYLCHFHSYHSCRGVLVSATASLQNYVDMIYQGTFNLNFYWCEVKLVF